MSNPLQVILQQAGLKPNYFSPTSRYFNLETKILESGTQSNIAYVKRRFIAPPEHFQLLQEHKVNEGERMDHIANQYLGDPEQFWRICDANAAMDPNDLTDTIGGTIRITLPEGIPGNNSNA